MKLENCPCCEKEVDCMTSRDLNIGQIYIECSNDNCRLCSEESPFYQEYMVFEDFEDNFSLVEIIRNRWNLWCKTKPTCYRDVSWEFKSDEENK